VPTRLSASEGATDAFFPLLVRLTIDPKPTYAAFITGPAAVRYRSVNRAGLPFAEHLRTLPQQR
jgi:hypothetical protein